MSSFHCVYPLVCNGKTYAGCFNTEHLSYCSIGIHQEKFEKYQMDVSGDIGLVPFS